MIKINNSSYDIQDKDIRNSIESILVEVENLELIVDENNKTISFLESELEDSKVLISSLEEDITNLSMRIKELEEALAESYLTDNNS